MHMRAGSGQDHGSTAGVVRAMGMSGGMFATGAFMVVVVGNVAKLG